MREVGEGAHLSKCGVCEVCVEWGGALLSLYRGQAWSVGGILPKSTSHRQPLLNARTASWRRAHMAGGRARPRLWWTVPPPPSHGGLHSRPMTRCWFGLTRFWFWIWASSSSCLFAPSQIMPFLCFTCSGVCFCNISTLLVQVEIC
jgi:hypothetical protein